MHIKIYCEPWQFSDNQTEVTVTVSNYESNKSYSYRNIFHNSILEDSSMFKRIFMHMAENIQEQLKAEKCT